jgi:pimeloyl-ACP methyl ester carboxylesterase
VLCLHGWPQHWYEWRHLLPALADRHRVLALDLRGFGSTEASRDGYEKEEMASDVLAVLDRLGLERVKLVGHDWGAWIGFLLCLREPRRFERYLALNILPPWTGARTLAPHLWRFWYQALILSPGLGYALHRSGRFVPKVLVGASTRKGVWDERTLRAFADNLAEPARARAAVQMYRVFNLREAPAIMRGRYAKQRLAVPTLMLFGADDQALRPELLEAMRTTPRTCGSSWSPAAATSSPTRCPSWSPSGRGTSSQDSGPEGGSGALLLLRVQDRIRASSRSRSRSICRIVRLARRPALRRLRSSSRSIPISSRRSSP